MFLQTGRRIGEILFLTNAGVSVPKIILLSHDIDLPATRELVGAFATPCLSTGDLSARHRTVERVRVLMTILLRAEAAR
jgi:hypothetical protein